MNEYRELFDGITASDDAKKETIEKLCTAAPIKSKKKVNLTALISAISTAACLIFVCTFFTIMFRPGNGGGNSQPATYALNQTYTHENGGTITFDGIELTETDSGYYLVLCGEFNLPSFTIVKDGIKLNCIRKDVTEESGEISFNFNKTLTQALSDADLHIEVSSAETKGRANIVFDVNENTAALIKNHLNSEATENEYDLELFIDGCYYELAKALFVFNFNQIILTT
ncbi:MAG: hypothetical protein K2N22_04220 [Clostridia bacterium]|nr:hypothetical protein [Clostridia bacterium]